MKNSMKILFVFDEKSRSEKALEKVASMIKGTGGSLTILYIQPRIGYANSPHPTGGGSRVLDSEKVFASVEGTEIRDRPAVRGTREARRSLREMGVKFNTITRRSKDPIKVISNVLGKDDYDLVYVAKGLNGVSANLLTEELSRYKARLKMV